AASGAEEESVPELINKWVSNGMIRHVHLNDPCLRAPGQGKLEFREILSALEENNYQDVLAVEPFDYFPDGRTQAARAIGYLQGVLEG
ncbi:MAG: sugar phosphate isomerase/epimerase, partial [Acidobacteriota bacterium]